MAHSLSRFSKSILDEPQLITIPRLNEISEYLENRDSGLWEKAMAFNSDKANQGDKKEDLAETTVGVLRIEGALTNKPTMFSAFCGLTSYQELIEQTKELVAMENINTIMMLVNSGGGEAYNTFNSSSYVKKLINESGKKLIAYIDGSAGSAAFAWTSIADEVIIHPDAMAGSIGVVLRLTNTNKADKQSGVEHTFITAGESKIPFDKDGEFKEEFKNDLQARVDELYEDFISHVAENRNISKSVVRNTEAKMFSANNALELGLVDKIMSNEEFYEYLADVTESSTTPSANTVKLGVTPDTNTNQKPSSMEHTMPDTKSTVSLDAEQLATLAALSASNEELLAELAAIKAEKAQLQTEATKAALTSKLSTFTFLNESKEGVLAFLADSEMSDSNKALLDSVLNEAQLSIQSVEDAATKLVAEEQEKSAAALAEAEKVKSEFATTQFSKEEKPEVVVLSAEDLIKAKVKATLSAKNK